MGLDRDMFRKLVAEAALSPSVHNTQPTRWRLTPDGQVEVLQDDSRRLAIGDPEGRDLNVSHGSAVEGFCLVSGLRGLAVEVRPGGGVVTRLDVGPGGFADPLAAFLAQRRTWRGKFEQGAAATAALARLERSDDVTVVQTPDEVARLADLYDAASLRWFRNAPIAPSWCPGCGCRDGIRHGRSTG